MSETMRLDDIDSKEYFKRKVGSKTVYVKGHWDRKSKTYSCTDTEDTNREIFLKGSTQVFMTFEY